MSDRLNAIQYVVQLVLNMKMSMWDACRISASKYQVDSDWLYREMTS